MARIPVRIIRRRQQVSKDPTPVPAWFTDTEHLSPCPCGEEPDASVVVVKSKGTELERWIHYRCLDWLEHEMDEDEIEAKREWERRRNQGEDDDE